MLHVLRTTALLLLLAQVAWAAGPDPATLDDAQLVQLLTEGDGQPLKCGTPYVAELQSRGLSLGALALAEGDTLEYLTPEGHFRIEYAVVGNVAVDTTDVDQTGVPDYVEMVGRSFERSWSVEVDSLGFAAPDIGAERYRVSLLLFSTGVFGQTLINPASPGGSWIQVNHSMETFCTGEDDPDACEVKLLQATIAHEFKHAVQVAEDWELFGFNGVSWIELDATWVEEIVYDDSNDYYRYLDLGTTPFTSPTTSLAQAASYQSVTWAHYLGEYYGQDIMVEYSGAVLARGFPQYGQRAYRDVTDARGLGWREVWRDYTAATYLCGERAAPGMGFEEAEGYPTAVTETVPSLPYADSKGLSDMAMRFYHFEVGPETTTRRLNIVLDELGTMGHLTVLAVFQSAEKTLVIPVPIVDGHAEFRPQPVLQDFDTVGVLVGNSRMPASSPGALSYSLSLGAIDVPTRPASMGGFKGRFRQRAGG